MPPKALSRFAERGAGWRTPSPTSALEYSLRSDGDTHTSCGRVAVIAARRGTVCGEVGRVPRFPQLTVRSLYYDALHVKNGIVKICLVESQGGIAPPTKRIIFNFAKEVGSPSAVDRTDYGTASGSARGFAQHHSQQLSRAAVSGDAQNINNAARNMRVAHSFMTGLNRMSLPPARGPSRPAGSLPPSPGPPGLAPQPLTDQRTAP